MKITDKNPLKPEWLKPREDAAESVMYLYATFMNRFEQDPRFGKKFVEENPDVIAQLVTAAMTEFAAKTR